jgi:uncharacterized membrane protein
MTSAFWALMFAVTAIALVFHWMPRFSRPDILFGVTVPEAFVSGAGRALVSRYRTMVWVGATAALTLSLSLPATHDPGSGGMLMTSVVGGYIVLAHVAWQLAHRRARAHAAPPSDVRVASLATRDMSLPGGALVAAGPFAIVLAAALLLYTYRHEVPDSADAGHPFGQLAFAAIFVMVMLTMAVTMARRSRQIAVDGPAVAAEQRFRRVNVLGPVLIAYAVAVVTSVGAVGALPAFGSRLGATAWLAVLPFMLVGAGVNYWLFRLGQGGHRAVGSVAQRQVRGDATPDRAWILGGLYYVNPGDPAMWVENRFGLGYTLNFGNWRAWLLIIGIMLVPTLAGRLLF